MTHDIHDPHADGAATGETAPAVFVGWLAIAMLVVMALFTALVLISAASSGFK